MNSKLSFSYKIVGKGAWGIETPQEGVKRFNLTEDGASWVDIFYLPEEMLPSREEFEKLWNLHPEAKGKIKIMGKELTTPRWQQSYLRGYWFSGMAHQHLPLPEEFKSFFDFANTSEHELWPEKIAVFNEVLINWYQDGSMYIGPHSDDEKSLVVGENGETLVWSLTLQEEGGNRRVFRLKPKTKGTDRLDIEMENGMVMIMGGTCQRTHKHQVVKTVKKCPRRVNVTFRVFKE